MFCSHCGTYNDAGARLCDCCGKDLYASPMPQVSSLTPAQNALKKIAGSPLFLVAVILYSTTILFNIIYSILGSNTMIIAGSLYSLINKLDLGYGFNSAFANAFNIIRNNGSFFPVFFSQIGNILIAVALWLIYTSAKNKFAPMKTAGLRIIRVINAIMIVFLCIGIIGVVAGAIALIVYIGNKSYYGYIGNLSEISAVIWVVAITLIIAIILALVFRSKVNTSIKSVMDTIKTGAPASNISDFITVICFIFTFTMFSRGISQSVESIKVLRYDIDYLVIFVFWVFINITSAATYFIFGLVLMKCKKEQKAIIMSSFGGAQYAPAPVYTTAPQTAYVHPPVQSEPVSAPVVQSFCPNCGTKCEKDTVFCASCGTKVK